MTSGPHLKKAGEMRKAKIEAATLALDAAIEALQEAALAYDVCESTGISVLHAAIALGQAHRELEAARR